MMTANSDLFIANCNTIAVAARDFAADNLPPLKDAAAAVTCGMCYSLIAETCDMLVTLSKKNVDLSNCEVDLLVILARVLIRGTTGPKTED
jgi:hypothetical protein